MSRRLFPVLRRGARSKPSDRVATAGRSGEPKPLRRDSPAYLHARLHQLQAGRMPAIRDPEEVERSPAHGKGLEEEEHPSHRVLITSSAELGFVSLMRYRAPSESGLDAPSRYSPLKSPGKLNPSEQEHNTSCAVLAHCPARPSRFPRALSMSVAQRKSTRVRTAASPELVFPPAGFG
jgi:hypothetical protein